MAKIRVTGPKEFTFNSVGSLVSDSVRGEERTMVWQSEHPISFFNVVAGVWEVHEGNHTRVFYDAQHAYNIEEISAALDAAYTCYSDWYTPYPWNELKLSEFANLATYAQGFPTNITFSEGIGFLARDKQGANAPFLISAHEAAHQWWGNILVPGKGPGGNVLSEGAAHFSTGLLIEEKKGVGGRIEFFRGIEENYNEQRSPDAERKLVLVDGSKEGDNTVMYDKGGWVFWMMLNLIGRENMLNGIQEFIEHYRNDEDHPVLQDFVRMIRTHAANTKVYDEFVQQWFFDVVVPQYKFNNVERNILDDGRWQVTGSITNVGTGRVPIEIAATMLERFDQDSKPRTDYKDRRVTATLEADESQEFTIVCPFEPAQVTVDPDCIVLQLKRRKAKHVF